MPGTRKLGRPTDHRRSMLRGLVTYLLENGKIETTVTRAKEVRCIAEKMITTAKTDSLHARRLVLAYVTKEDVVKKLFDEIAPEYRDVKGGYTRIVRTAPRRGDAAEMCIIELVETEAEKAKAAKAKKSKATKKTAEKKTTTAKTAKTEKAEKPAEKKAAPAAKPEKVQAKEEKTAEVKEKPAEKKATPAEKPVKAEEKAAEKKATSAEKPAKAEEKAEKADKAETAE